MGTYSNCAHLGIQIASDLHIEFFLSAPKENEPSIWSSILTKAEHADTLALLGDIGVLTSDASRAQYIRFLGWCILRWTRVVVLTGNHEYYTNKRDIATISDYCVHEVDEFLGNLCRQEEFEGKLFFLQKGKLELSHVIILGCTLWSHIPDIAEMEVRNFLKDYRLIYCEQENQEKCGSKIIDRINPSITNSWHIDHLEWLRYELTAILSDATTVSKNVVVLSHHTPSMNGTSDPIYENNPFPTRYRCHGFSSDLLSFINEYSCIDVWCYGHTHYNNKQILPRSAGGENHAKKQFRLVSNQFGYLGNCLEYDPMFTI